MKKLVAVLPACSAVSNRVRLMSLTVNSANDTSSDPTSRAKAGSLVAATASSISARTSSSENSAIKSSLSSGLTNSACNKSRSSRVSCAKRILSARCLKCSRTSGLASAAFNCAAAARSVKSTRKVRVTSSLSSAPLYSSPLLDTTMELISPSRPNNCWARLNGSNNVGCEPALPPLSTTPFTVIAARSPYK